ncbi:MAG TPA: OB-fold domain-containing protein [Acidimicrobiales bacterium]|nr:OB-fold domain-containing protein [Acidimicrobiales bacterium]
MSTQASGADTTSGQQIPVVDYLVIEGEPHLEANACTGCGALFFDRRNACARCGALDFTRKALSTTGMVRSFTIIHRAAPNVPVPYVSSVVELDGGGVVKANLVDAGAEPDKIELGMRVRLTTFVCGRDEEGTEAVAFAFAPA